MKRILASGITVALLLVMLVPTAHASVVWCEDDPMIKLQIPGMQPKVVYVTDYAAGAQHQVALHRTRVTYETRVSADKKSVAVTMYVLIPTDRFGSFKTRSVVSTGRRATGTILASDQGISGQPLVMKFTLTN